MCVVFFWMQKQIEKRTASNGKEVKKRRTNNENKLLERAAGKYAAEPASVVSDCPWFNHCFAGFQLRWQDLLNYYHFSLRGVLWWKNLISLFNIKVWGKKLRLVVWYVWFQNAFLLRKWYELTNFHTHKNGVQELIESQEAEIGFNLFGGIDKEVEEVAPNIITEDLRMSNNNEQTVSTNKLGCAIIILAYVFLNQKIWQDLEYSCSIWQKVYLHCFWQSMDINDENNYNVTESSSAVVLSLSKQVSVRKKGKSCKWLCWEIK